MSVAVLASAGCSGADELPDIASQMVDIHTVVTNEISANGGPGHNFGPYYPGQMTDMFAACLGGGRMRLMAVNAKGEHIASIWGECSGQLIGGGVTVGVPDEGIDFACLVPSFKGDVTAWEVVVTNAAQPDGQGKSLPSGAASESSVCEAAVAEAMPPYDW